MLNQLRGYLAPRQQHLVGQLAPQQLRLNGRLALHVGSTPLYEGPYEVTPSDDEQVLPAGGLRMRRNVTVYAVPFDLAERQDIDRLF